MINVNVDSLAISSNVEIGRFTDGTLKMRVPMGDHEYLPGRRAYVTWLYEGEEELSALIHTVFHLRNKGIEDVTLCMPYIPNARQDRTKSPDEVFTMQSFAKTINWLNFTAVIVSDAHSRVSTALIDRVRNLMPDAEIETAINDATTMWHSEKVITFYPDEGAMTRYSKSHEYPIVYGKKTRSPHTGRVETLELYGDTSAIKGADVMIIDDICARGDTALRSALALKEAGAKHVSVFVTHCENTILDSDLIKSDAVDFIYTTKSIYTGNHPKVKVVEW